MNHSLHPNIEQAIINHATSLDLSTWNDQETVWWKQLKGEDISLLMENCPHLSSLTVAYPDERCLEYFASFSHLTSLHIIEYGCMEGVWQSLGLLKHLKHLTVEHIYKIKEEFFQSLTAIPHLTSLMITDSGEYMVDCYFSHLSKLKNLTSLTIRECQSEYFTEESFKYIAALGQLTFLEVTRCFIISDEGIQDLMPLKNLQGLKLSFTAEVTNKGFYLLANLKKLRQLSLDACSLITHEGFRQLAYLPKLRDLHLNDCRQMINEDLKVIGSLKKLENLTLDACHRITDDGTRELASLTELRHLKLEWSHIKNCQFLETLLKLESLDLIVQDITDDQIDHLLKLNSLKSLDLSCCPLTDNGIKKLKRLPKLRSLRLYSCDEITGEGLGSLSSLKDLDVSNSIHLTNQGLRSFASLKHLTHLNLENCNLITDEGLRSLSSLTNLTHLNLRCSLITEKGLLHLTALKNLKEIHLKHYVKHFTQKGMSQLPFRDKVCYY